MAIILCPKCQEEILEAGQLDRIRDTSTARVNKPSYHEVLQLFKCEPCNHMYYRLVDSWPIKSL